MTRSVISVQLYSVRDALEQSRPQALLRLAGLGFRHVEPFGLGVADVDPDVRIKNARSLRADLDGAGLAVSAVHVSVPDDIGTLIDEVHAMGAETAIVPNPRKFT